MRRGCPNIMTAYELRVLYGSKLIDEEVMLNEDFLAKLLNSLSNISNSVPLLSIEERILNRSLSQLESS